MSAASLLGPNLVLVAEEVRSLNAALFAESNLGGRQAGMQEEAFLSRHFRTLAANSRQSLARAAGRSLSFSARLSLSLSLSTGK